MQPTDVSRTSALHESRADAALPADGSFPGISMQASGLIEHEHDHEIGCNGP